MKLTEKEKTKRKLFVIHVHFLHPVDDRTDYFFGNLRAIFDKFSPEDVGTTLTKLWNANAGKGFKVCTRMCTIEKVEVLRSPQKIKK